VDLEDLPSTHIQRFQEIQVWNIQIIIACLCLMVQPHKICTKSWVDHYNNMQSCYLDNFMLEIFNKACNIMTYVYKVMRGWEGVGRMDGLTLSVNIAGWTTITMC